MKTGFPIFLAAFVALGASWYGLVYGPIEQLGGAKQTSVLQSGDAWPQQRTGEATRGLQVYRECGCAACHTLQVRQTGVRSEITLTSLGANKATDFKEFLKSLMIVPELLNSSNALVGNLSNWDGTLPKTLYVGDDSTVTATLAEKLAPAGVKTESRVVSLGADIDRSWGTRQSVAADYLYDQPVQLGALRAGPDLTLIGIRDPDVNWQLLHLYAPGSVLKKSTMPPFRFLFEVRRQAAGRTTPGALVLPPEYAPPAGMEVVPTTAARELAAFLVSLKANAPLYEAPSTASAQSKQ